MNIHEVLEYGPIVASDEDTGILITVNGAYFNVWVPEWHERGASWENTEAYDMRSRVRDRNGTDSPTADGLYGLHIVDVMNAASELLDMILTGDEEDIEYA